MTVPSPSQEPPTGLEWLRITPSLTGASRPQLGQRASWPTSILCCRSACSRSLLMSAPCQTRRGCSRSRNRFLAIACAASWEYPRALNSLVYRTMASSTRCSSLLLRRFASRASLLSGLFRAINTRPVIAEIIATHHAATPIHPAAPCHTATGQKPISPRMIQNTVYVEQESPNGPRSWVLPARLTCVISFRPTIERSACGTRTNRNAIYRKIVLTATLRRSFHAQLGTKVNASGGNLWLRDGRGCLAEVGVWLRWKPAHPVAIGQGQADGDGMTSCAERCTLGTWLESLVSAYG